MNKKVVTNTQKIVRRTGSSVFFGGMSLFVYFPYQRLTWNFSLFILAFCGVVLAALNLIAINHARADAKGKGYVLTKKSQTLSRIAWWLTFVPFLGIVIGLMLTGILACSLYL